MTKKRKTPKRSSFPARPVLQNLKEIGRQVNHPVLLQEIETNPHRNQESQQQNYRRLMCFSGIPACLISAKGGGSSVSFAEESAAHAMLDFFRLAISPGFVTQLIACGDDATLCSFLPQIAVVFKELEKAIEANYMSIQRCNQFELSSATSVRGKEVKKRILMNLKDPFAGYLPKAGKNPDAPEDLEQEVPAVNAIEAGLEQAGSAPEVVLLDDDNESSNGSRASSASDDVVFVDEVINTKGTQQTGAGTTPNGSTKRPSKSPSPQLKILRDYDEFEKNRIHEMQDKRHEIHRRFNNLDSNTYFGKLNTSNAGPPEVFCCLPNANPTQYAEAQSSDESEDEGEKDVPKKRARIDNDDDVIVLNMTTSDQVSGTPGCSSDINEKLVKDADSDEELGDIVDEWNEIDDSEDNTEKEVEETGVTEEVAIENTTPVQAKNKYYDGLSSHREFIESRKIPVNYQVKTVGVVINEKLCRQVEKYVESVTDKQLDSVSQLSKMAWIHYVSNIQDDTVYALKMKARQLIHAEIQKIFPDKQIGLHVTGSTVNGCGSYNSDMDMCICYPINFRGTVFDDFQCDRSHSAKILRKLDKAIRRCKIGQSIRRVIATCKIIPAKVPIVKCDLTRDFNHIDVDINVNNIAGIYNSHLTHYYSLTDARFPALALLVKHWAFKCGVGNAPEGYLNSYTIILLVIHYLQCGVTPAVLPNLQYLFPDKFDRKLPINELSLFGHIVDNLPISVPNTWSLGELVVGFFHYFSNFDFQNLGISIRSAQVIPRSCLPRETSYFPLFIEEPFDAVNTARSVRTSGHMNTIKAAIRRASHALSPHRKFSLDDIGVEVRQ